LPIPEGRTTGVDHVLPALSVVTSATAFGLAPMTAHHLVDAHATACGTNAWGKDEATVHRSDAAAPRTAGRNPAMPMATQEVAAHPAPVMVACTGSAERFQACPMVDDTARIGVGDEGSNGVPTATQSPELPHETAERLEERYGLGWPRAAPVDDVGWMLVLCDEQAETTTERTRRAAVTRHGAVIRTRRRMAPIVGGALPLLVSLTTRMRLPSESWVGSMSSSHSSSCWPH
jgi:hypothetical protein